MLTADFSRGLPDLRSGIYRHYKGHLYMVFGYGHDANASELWLKGGGIDGRDPCLHYRLGDERAVVVYMGLELDEAHKGPRLAVRTAEDFFTLVCSACGNDWECIERHPGEAVPRFEYVGPAWYGQR